MKIVELILDEDQDTIGIDAISIVESPAIESDFVALNQQEIKLAEVDKEKKILLGALLIPNKPIYRNGEEGEYYIFFSKDTIVKASQMYLQNGYQNKSTLEHSKALEGLTLVESWIVEDEVNDKSRKYGLNVPVGTWMGAVKVNNEEIWQKYVKGNLVKGFSIEGYFADKMERPKESVKEDMGKTMEVEAAELLSKIESIVKGEKLELGMLDDLEKASKNLFSDVEKAGSSYVKYDDYLVGASKPFGEMIKNYDKLIKSLPVAEEMSKRFLKAGEELGVDVKNNKTYLIINENIKMSNNVIQSINSYDDPSSFL
jgi:hypothetical protein